MIARLIALTSLGACAARTTPQPPPCPTAPVVASSQADLDALAGCPTLAGLTIRSAAPLDLAPLATLTAVRGDLVIGPTLALERVTLPALAEVGGRLAIVSYGGVRGVVLLALTRVGALELRDSLGLTEVLIPRLATVTAAVLIVRVPALELVDASALTTVGAALTITAPRLATWLGTPPTPTGPRTVDAPGLPAP